MLQLLDLHQGVCVEHGHQHCVAVVVHRLGHGEAMVAQSLHEGVFLQSRQPAHRRELGRAFKGIVTHHSP